METLNLSTLPDLGLLPSHNETGTGYRDRKLFPVPVHERDAAESGFAKLAAKCTKRMKTEAPRLVWQARGQYEVRRYWKDDDGQERSRSRLVPCFFASIEGTRPKIAGWNLAARMVRLETGEMISRNVPGVEIPERYRDVSLSAVAHRGCEHCNLSRVRNDIFIVHNADSGEFKQVGRTCLRDFLGHDPSAILNAWNAHEFMESQGSEFLSGYSVHNVPMFPTLEVLETAACSIRLESWVSRKASDLSGKVSTSGIVARLLMDSKHLTRNEAALYHVTKAGDVGAVSDADKQTAMDSLAWARSLPGESDYERNMKAATKHDSCDARTFGLVCSAIAGYLRTVSRAAELNLKRSMNATSEHVGQPKERLRSLPATVEHMRNIESDFGGCTLYKFRDESGNLLSWFASGRNVESVRPGDKVSLTGTVKKHAEYNGTKETQLSRCTIAKLASVAS